MKHSIFNEKKAYGLLPLFTVFLIIASVLIPDFVSFAATDVLGREISDKSDTEGLVNWPVAPEVSGESAILMELETGAIIYSKNMHAAQYPASTTKILTTLIASETCSLGETVKISNYAVKNTPRDSNHIAMNAGEHLSMEDSLKAILIRSANEVAFAVAEKISGDVETFAVQMNARARELGCVDSNFVNPNGLPDENHYTSAYDLAMIGRSFFSNSLLCEITTTPVLHIVKEKTGDYYDRNKMELLPNMKYSYEYLVGCKSGSTTAARYCLVSCAEKDGLKLICVIMKSEYPDVYEDTIDLFNYGFENFVKYPIAEVETRYNIDDSGFFNANIDIFGDSTPLLSLDETDCIVIPKNMNINDLSSTVSFIDENGKTKAGISYCYQNMFLGNVDIKIKGSMAAGYEFKTDMEVDLTAEKINAGVNFVFINIVKVIGVICAVTAAVILIVLIRRFLHGYSFRGRINPKAKKYRAKRSSKRRSNYKNSPYSGMDFNIDKVNRANARDEKRR